MPAHSEDKYYEFLEKHNIAELLDSKSIKFKEYMRDNISRIIYYSSYIEGNKLDEKTSTAILNGNAIVYQDGRLQDYIEISNHGKAYEELVKLSEKIIDVEDVINLRKTLLKDIIGEGKYEGLRRLTLIGPSSIETPENVYSSLERILDTINKAPKNKIDAFIRALKFHSEFEELHPFEDGNGRVGRLLMNLYLMKNNMSPMLITESDKNQMYFSGLEAHHRAEYFGGLVYQMLYIYLRELGADKLVSIADSAMDFNPREIEYRDVIYSITGRYKEDLKMAQLIDDIKFLYNNEDEDATSSFAALYLIGLNDVKYPNIIDDALNSKNDKIRALAMYRRSNFIQNKTRLIDIALRDSNIKNRAHALFALGITDNVSTDLFKEICKNEKEDIAIAYLLDAFSWTKRNSKYIELIKPLLNSNSATVRAPAYRAIMTHGTDIDIRAATTALAKKKDSITFDDSLYYLMKTKKINLNDVAKIIVNFAEKDENVRKALLGSFSENLLGNEDFVINNNYVKFFEQLLTNKYSAVERAYTEYLVGMFNGYKELFNKYGIQMDSKNPTVENIALFLTKMSESKSEDTGAYFSIKDNKLNIVEAIELNKFIGNNEFGKHFLLLCLKELKRWN